MLPPHETLPYRLLRAGALTYLVSDLTADAPSGVCLRYAYPRLYSREPFFPTMTADDWGTLYRGMNAVDWLIASGPMYPRSDVMGLRPDATADQLFLKELDLAVPPMIYVAASVESFPGEPVAAAVEIATHLPYALAPGGQFPARIQAATPTFQMHAALCLRLPSDAWPRALAHSLPISLARLEAFASAVQSEA